MELSSPPRPSSTEPASPEAEGSLSVGGSAPGRGPECHTAQPRLRLQHCVEIARPNPFQHSLHHREVHRTHKVTVVGGKGVEWAVAEVENSSVRGLRVIAAFLEDRAECVVEPVAARAHAGPPACLSPQRHSELPSSLIGAFQGLPRMLPVHAAEQKPRHELVVAWWDMDAHVPC